MKTKITTTVAFGVWWSISCGRVQSSTGDEDTGDFLYLIECGSPGEIHLSNLLNYTLNNMHILWHGNYTPIKKYCRKILGLNISEDQNWEMEVKW